MNKVDNKQKKDIKGIKIPFFTKSDDNDKSTNTVAIANQAAAETQSSNGSGTVDKSQEKASEQAPAAQEEYEPGPSEDQIRTLKKAMDLEAQTAALEELD